MADGTSIDIASTRDTDRSRQELSDRQSVALVHESIRKAAMDGRAPVALTPCGPSFT
jgi:hypothetical protein